MSFPRSNPASEKTRGKEQQRGKMKHLYTQPQTKYTGTTARYPLGSCMSISRRGHPDVVLPSISAGISRSTCTSISSPDSISSAIRPLSTSEASRRQPAALFRIRKRRSSSLQRLSHFEIAVCNTCKDRGRPRLESNSSTPWLPADIAVQAERLWHPAAWSGKDWSTPLATVPHRPHAHPTPARRSCIPREKEREQVKPSLKGRAIFFFFLHDLKKKNDEIGLGLVKI